MLKRCITMHQPGIEPRSHRWQRCILPLDHWCPANAFCVWVWAAALTVASPIVAGCTQQLPQPLQARVVHGVALARWCIATRLLAWSTSWVLGALAWEGRGDLESFAPEDPVTCSGKKNSNLPRLGGREHPWSSGYDGCQLDLDCRGKGVGAHVPDSAEVGKH